ncbi:hypothetical protein BG015_007396 [Linnemannia schmuckeri]|uniref:Uncharacterized protein n=1 Tax=Linnemannia schmuckeri TaxID=64567 RepID=A0A9P5VBB8_9FUNG|nr:hypothetical protein BG015_007396 [Linnemannia schmuckeri]
MIQHSRTAPKRPSGSIRAFLIFSIILTQISYQPLTWAQSVEDVNINTTPDSSSSLPPPPSPLPVVLSEPAPLSAEKERTPRHLINEQATPYIPPPTTFPPDQWGNRIPDFSQVGYRRGHIPLPTIIPIAITLQPSIDPRINDRARIQNAIDYVSSLPLKDVVIPDTETTIQARGVVLLQAGIYRIQGSLILNQSGVVLRGEGNGPDGTVLMAMGQFKHDFINLHGLQDPSFQSTPEYLAANIGSRELYPKNSYIILDDEVTQVADEYIPVGTFRLPVKDTSNFKVGGQVMVERYSSKNWIRRLGMDHIPKRPGDPARTVDWDSRQYDLRYVRKIKAIELRDWKVGDSGNIVSGAAVGDEVVNKAVVAAAAASVNEDTRQASSINGPQAILRYTADTNRTGKPQPFEAQKDFEEIQITVQDSQSKDNDDGGINTDGTPGYLQLDIPLVMNMDPVYGAGVVYNFKRKTHIPTDVGLENLALYSQHDPSNPYDEHHGWFAVLIDHCENCWVANVKTHHFVSGIKAGPGSKHVTIQDCEVLEPVSMPKEGGRRYMFMLQGQMGLVKRCFSEDARHDFITGAKTRGPNVFVDSEGVRANNDAGPHDRWTTGTLYDNIHSADLNVRNRGWMGSGQGWAGAFHVVYHSSADIPARFQSPPGATNWIVGFEGTLGDKGVEFDGYDATFLDPEPYDIGHTPRSLYWAQLVARLGGTEKAAEWVEKTVGVKGKSQYKGLLGRKFLSLNEIVLAGKDIQSLSRLEKDREEEQKQDEAEMEASIEQLQKDIQRMESEIREHGYGHLLNDDEDEVSEEDTW